MFFRRNIRNVIGLTVMSLVIGNTVAFSQETLPVHQNEFNTKLGDERDCT